MRQEVGYGGVTSATPDRLCTDGELSVCMNAVPDVGGLRPVLTGECVMRLDSDCQILAVHETAKFKHYIVVNGDFELCWTDTEDGSKAVLNVIGQVGGPGRITVLGNTLLFIEDTTHKPYHYLWKNDAYKALGSHLPELGISFGLRGTVEQQIEDITYRYYDHGTYLAAKEEDEGKLAAQSAANKFIANYATKKGKFMFPFFVRYAYRLFDGTLTMHSAPVLMIPNAGFVPMVKGEWRKFDDDGYPLLKFTTSAVVAKLDMQVIDGLAKLKEWADIVQSVDIFVTEGIRYYDQGGEFTNRVEPLTNGWDAQRMHYGVYRAAALVQTTSASGNTSSTQKAVYARHIPYAPTGTYCSLPQKSDEEVEKGFTEASNFFLLKSVSLDDLKQGERVEVNVADDYLQSLLNREVMTDDYDSHDELRPRGAVAYNSRMNLYGIEKSIYKGASARCLFPHTDGCVHYNGGSETPLHDPDNYNDPCRVSVYVWIEPDGGAEQLVQCDTWTNAGWYTPLVWFYHPSPYAKKVMVVEEMMDKDGNVQYTRSRCAKLTRHKFLNGSYFFDGLHGRMDGWADEAQNAGDRPIPGTTQEPEVISASVEMSIPNKLYTSEVNNPFMFPVTNINTIGAGEIISVTSAAKALSQGQFGQFPLYALCSDGVWALETSSTGGFSSKQPFARDVCLGQDAVAQLDGSVLFATERGIMHVSGSSVECVSEMLDNFGTLDLGEMPGACKLLGRDSFQIAAFADYLTDCNLMYDYAHQRVTVYNTKYQYAYVYSLRTRSWGMCDNPYLFDINSYPECIAQKRDGVVLNLSVDQDRDVPIDAQSRMFLLTRPFKFGAPDTRKTISELAQRGDFRAIGWNEANNREQKQVLYGTNDLRGRDWHPVWAAEGHYMRGFSGTPYKYFRLLYTTWLCIDETLSGFSAEVLPRFGGKMR